MQTSMDNLSVWGLISEASVLVQLVIIVLVLASMISWFLIVQRSVVMRRQEQAFTRFLQQFRASKSPEQLYPASSVMTGKFTEKAGQPMQESGIVQIFNQGVDEFQQLSQDNTLVPNDVIDGVERRLLSSIADEEEKLGQHLPFLATVGSVSPYIGLFGTVWGIMNSFIGLSQVEQATLNTVAPGIAEALIATAIGLFAAIPAVIAYNRLSARSEKMSGRYYSFANELQTRLYRRLTSTKQPAMASGEL
jgi:biopolymer transport protein TolQ